MKRCIISIVITLIFASSYAQEISRDKDRSISNIKAAGYEVKYFLDENKFAYVRYDKYGKSVVGYEYTGNIVRRVIFLCDDPSTPGKMLLDILRGTTRANMDRARAEFGNSADNEMYDYSSIYYNGKAKYSYNNNYSAKEWIFTVTLLD